MSESVRAGLAKQLGSGYHADVLVRFHIERDIKEQLRQQGADDVGARRNVRFVGEAMRAHKIILTLGSTFLKSRLNQVFWPGPGNGPGRPVGTTDSSQGSYDEQQPTKKQRLDVDLQYKTAAVSALPEVLVPLSSKAEVPFARQAIEYIYTGSLSADLGFEALLRVRQQACYLGVESCPQACDRAMVGWLQPGEGQGQQQGQGQGQGQQQEQGHDADPSSDEEQQEQEHGADTGAGPSAAEPRVLQAYACHDLFPDPGTSPDAASFDAVRSALAKQLVLLFGDAVAALTRPDLYQQLLQLPAVAVRELLAADDFGTDSEDSVFLMLVCWLGADLRNRRECGSELCHLVRLHRMGRTYLHSVLPSHCRLLKGFHDYLDWLELGILLQYAGAGEQEQKALLELDSERRASPWYCSPARRQVVPEEGRTVEWSISREQLVQGLREMAEGQEAVYVYADFEASAAALYGESEDGESEADCALCCGLRCGVAITLDPAMLLPGGAVQERAAGVFTCLDAPPQLGEVEGVASVHARVVVHSWEGRQRAVGFSAVRTPNDVWPLGCHWGWDNAMELRPLSARDAAAQRGAAAAAAAAAHLKRFRGWLRKGKITGTVTLMRAPWA